MNVLKIFKPKEKKDFLVLDFGRSSVKGIIFSPPIIKNYQVEKIERFGIFDGKDFELDVLKRATTKVIEGLGIKEEIAKFSQIISFSPDILKAEILDLSYTREKEERIEKKEQEEIYQFIFKKAEEKLSQEFEKDLPGYFKILKKKILEEKVSGYRVSSISNFKGKNLNFKILVIFCPRDYLNFVDSLKISLGLAKAEIYHIVEGLFNLMPSDSGIFVNIGAKNTLVICFKKQLKFIEDFQIGGADFSKKISETLGLKEDDAENLKKDFSKNKLSVKIKKRLEEIISPLLISWQKKLKEKLESRIKPFDFSQKVYLFGGGSLIPGIKRVLKELGVRKINYLLAKNLPLKNKTKISFSAKDTSSLLLTFCK